MIGLFVNDLKKMVHFYNKVIGIKIDWDGQGPYAEFKHDGIRFAMYDMIQGTVLWHVLRENEQLWFYPALNK